MVAYLFAKGEYNEALNHLEMALTSDPEKHYILFDYLPQLQENKVIVDIINRYTNVKSQTAMFGFFSEWQPFFGDMGRLNAF
jgi:tetratricopeptide (TPR) repeat protein